MIQLTDHGVFLNQENERLPYNEEYIGECRKNTMAYQIFKSHNTSSSMENLKLKFDAVVSPDNNYVSILQTVKASGVEKFPVPYVLSNCHNTLCAVGGTINEDDHTFGMDNVKRFGGIFVPPYKAVIHQYMREMMAGGGKMILGSDSHTRYGALGTLAIGEGGGEIAKQLLAQTYDIRYPQIIAVKLTDSPRPGVGPQDVALTIIGATFKNNFNKNKVMEFVGEGIHNLSVEYRMGIDVMTTESAALSSIWCTDERVEQYLTTYGRPGDFKEIRPQGIAYYDSMIEIDLAKVECMMALPYHPSNVVSIHEFNADPEKYLREAEEEGQKIKGTEHGEFHLMQHLRDGKVYADQALVSGCSGGLFENIAAIADILGDYSVAGNQEAFGINPASQPVFAELARHGILNRLIHSGATIRPCICGPCFGVTDVPADNQLSIRHVTRNYPNREGSKPGKGQMAASILMDARSIAATVRNGGCITAASDLSVEYHEYEYHYNTDYYKNQVYDCYGRPDETVEIRKGPNIADWPEINPVGKNLFLKTAGAYKESVTTDDLSPSGDAVAYRSNPMKLSEFTMINKDPDYVSRSREILEAENARKEGRKTGSPFEQYIETYCEQNQISMGEITIGSVMAGIQIGDGSSREQAASSQKILGGYADIAVEYATKRYRSNLINWGILPIVSKDAPSIQEGDVLFIENIPEIIAKAGTEFVIKNLTRNTEIMGNIGEMTEDEKEILGAGCLINYNRKLL